jgi:hypothetical protein
LAGNLFRRAAPVKCPQNYCSRFLTVTVFPALYRARAVGSAGEALQAEGEAGCFFHPERRAVVACESCGRFLCALCQIRLGERNLCAGCIEAGKKKRRIVNLDRERPCHDYTALVLAIGPAVLPPLWFFTIITAPFCLFWVIRHWNTPRSIVRPSRWRFVLALVLAGLEIAGLAIFGILMLNS